MGLNFAWGLNFASGEQNLNFRFMKRIETLFCTYAVHTHALISCLCDAFWKKIVHSRITCHKHHFYQALTPTPPSFLAAFARISRVNSGQYGEGPGVWLASGVFRISASREEAPKTSRWVVVVEGLGPPRKKVVRKVISLGAFWRSFRHAENMVSH